MLQLTMIRWRYEQNFLWTSECVVFLLLEPPSYTKLNVNASVMYLHWNACFKKQTEDSCKQPALSASIVQLHTQLLSTSSSVRRTCRMTSLRLYRDFMTCT